MPKRRTPKDKKKFAEDAVDWIRRNEPQTDNLDKPSIDKLTNLASEPLPEGPSPRAERTKALRDALDWLRKNNPRLDNIKNPTVEAFSNLSGLALPKDKSPRSNKKFLEDAIDWLRKNAPDLEDVDDNTIEEVTKIAGVKHLALLFYEVSLERGMNSIYGVSGQNRNRNVYC